MTAKNHAGQVHFPHYTPPLYEKSHPEEWLNMFNVNYFESTCYSLLKLSDLVSYLDATDRTTKCTAAAVVHYGITIAEVEIIGVGVVRT